MTTQDITSRPTLVPPPSESEPTELDRLWRQLGRFLTCSIEVSDESQSRGRKQHMVTVRAVNEAPASSDSLQVVFHGIGLEVVPLRAQGRVPAWADSIVGTLDADGEHADDPPDDIIPWPEAAPKRVYVPGEVLYPGDSIRYEFRVPASDIPYFDYRLRAGLSWKHLFWNTSQLSAPDEIARAPMVAAFKAMNELNVHAPLLALLKTYPDLSDETSAEEVAPFRRAIMSQLPRIHILRTSLAAVQETAPDDALRAMVGTAIDYLGGMVEACGLLQGALSSGKVAEVRAGVRALEGARRSANVLNETTERLMASHGVGDEETGYRYR